MPSQQRLTIPYTSFENMIKMTRINKNGKINSNSIIKLAKERNNDSKFISSFSVDEITNSWSHDHTVMQDTSFDMYYFKEQKKFIKSLSKEEISILASYTKYGDRLINGMLRNKFSKSTIFSYIESIQGEEFNEIFKYVFTSPLTRDNCYYEVERYVKIFQKLFQKVPILNKAIRVFRGIYVDDLFDPRTQGIVSPTYDFISSTYAPYESSLNNYSGKDCCIMEFIIQPGVRALWIEPISYFNHELEIIIENNVDLYNGCRKIKKLMHDTNNNNVDFRDIEVFEFEVKPHVSFFKSIKNTTRRMLSKLCYIRGTRRNKINNKSVN